MRRVYPSHPSRFLECENTIIRENESLLNIGLHHSLDIIERHVEEELPDTVCSIVDRDFNGWSW